MVGLSQHLSLSSEIRKRASDADLTITKMTPSIVGDDIAVTIHVHDKSGRSGIARTIIKESNLSKMALELVNRAKKVLAVSNASTEAPPKSTPAVITGYRTKTVN